MEMNKRLKIFAVVLFVIVMLVNCIGCWNLKEKAESKVTELSQSAASKVESLKESVKESVKEDVKGKVSSVVDGARSSVSSAVEGAVSGASSFVSDEFEDLNKGKQNVESAVSSVKEKLEN